MRYYLIGFGSVIVFFAIGVFILTPVNGMLRTQNYIVQDQTWNAWQTIQYENPNCSRLPNWWFINSIEIPSSGFLCTSSQMFTGWHRRNFYRRTKSGSLVLINDKVSGDSSFGRNESTTSVNGTIQNGLESCQWQGEQFFVGDETAEKNSVMENDDFLAANPNCRERITF